MHELQSDRSKFLQCFCSLAFVCYKIMSLNCIRDHDSAIHTINIKNLVPTKSPATIIKMFFALALKTREINWSIGLIFAYMSSLQTVWMHVWYSGVEKRQSITGKSHLFAKSFNIKRYTPLRGYLQLLSCFIFYWCWPLFSFVLNKPACLRTI